RELGGVGEEGLGFGDDLAVCLGGCFDFDPVGVVLEGVPTFLGGVAAVVGQDVNERVLGARLFGGRPIANVRHAVFFEQLGGVVAKSRKQVGELAGLGCVGA